MLILIKMVLIKKYIKLILIFIAIVIVFSELALSIQDRKLIIQNNDEDKIFLYSRQFVPLEKFNISQSNKTHFLIQLENFPTEEES